jgi:hypothetical protein
MDDPAYEAAKRHAEQPGRVIHSVTIGGDTAELLLELGRL